jgi:hypothetical protein
VQTHHQDPRCKPAQARTHLKRGNPLTVYMNTMCKPGVSQNSNMREHPDFHDEWRLQRHIPFNVGHMAAKPSSILHWPSAVNELPHQQHTRICSLTLKKS